MNKKILIGGAWPYANGSLHIGHLAGLLPGDVIARYYRAKGQDVYYVSGSDCHGTPVTIRAKQEGKTYQEVSDHYHEEFKTCFEKLGFSYDLYGKTSQEEHISFVREFHQKLYQSNYVYEKSVLQAFCESCNQFLPDRFVEGLCPKCRNQARGDQCDVCGAVLETETLVKPTCSICGSRPVFRETKHLYIAISKLEAELKALVNQSNWRKNALAFTNRYLEEGVRDRALTRDLDWGIDVPFPGYEHKKIYIWAENVLGYLSMSFQVANERGVAFEELWGENARHYYVHAKDNIPFHTIILPALLLAHGANYRLPDDIISNEYLTLEGRKISTSQNWAIWVKDIVDNYQADSIRYFLIANGPEKRDTDFTWNEFIKCHNGELLGAYGNFINRVLVFVHKYFEGKVPDGQVEDEIETRFIACYQNVGNKIEQGKLKDGLEDIFELIRAANKYFDRKAPWISRNTDVRDCEITLYNCIVQLVNFAVLLEPFLPFSSEKVIAGFGIDKKWAYKHISPGTKVPELGILFQRLEGENK